MKYRKLPVVIEAFQMTKERRQSNVDWPEWLHLAWNTDKDERNCLQPVGWPKHDGNGKLQIYTLEGVHIVDWDDYIIQGVQGELYPIKADIFKKTYERC